MQASPLREGAAAAAGVNVQGPRARSGRERLRKAKLCTKGTLAFRGESYNTVVWVGGKGGSGGRTAPRGPEGAAAGGGGRRTARLGLRRSVLLVVADEACAGKEWG